MPIADFRFGEGNSESRIPNPEWGLSPALRDDMYVAQDGAGRRNPGCRRFSSFFGVPLCGTAWEASDRRPPALEFAPPGGPHVVLPGRTRVLPYPTNPGFRLRLTLGYVHAAPQGGAPDAPASPLFRSSWAMYIESRQAGLRMSRFRRPGRWRSSVASPRPGRGGGSVRVRIGTSHVELGTWNREPFIRGSGTTGDGCPTHLPFPGALPKSKIENRKSKMFAGSRFPGNLETTLNVAPPYLGKTSAPERLRCRSVLQTRGILCRSIRVRLEAST